MRLPTYRYSVGQKLLCFEPDASKAKVIYFAKVLKHVRTADSALPHYAVHFHGWKCKWDREVPEHLLLENTEFNRTLKKKIDDIARYERSRYKRKHRIDSVLENAAMCGDDIDWDTIPGVWVNHKKNRSKTKCKIIVPSPVVERSPVKELCSVPDEDQLDVLDGDDLTQLQYENLEVHQLFAIPVNIPTNLQGILDADRSAADASAVENGWCSVLQVLQAYVDGFPYENFKIPYDSFSQSVTCSERVVRALGPVYSHVDQSRLMCADYCSSVLLLFNQILHSHLLLLPWELTTAQQNRTQFSRNGLAFEFMQHVPAGVKSIDMYSSPRYELLPDVEVNKSPGLPCVNYPARFLLRIFALLPTLVESMSLTSCRRSIVLRHTHLLLHYLEKTRHYWFARTSPHKHDSQAVGSPQTQSLDSPKAELKVEPSNSTPIADLQPPVSTTVARRPAIKRSNVKSKGQRTNHVKIGSTSVKTVPASSNDSDRTAVRLPSQRLRFSTRLTSLDPLNGHSSPPRSSVDVPDPASSASCSAVAVSKNVQPSDTVVAVASSRPISQALRKRNPTTSQMSTRMTVHEETGHTTMVTRSTRGNSGTSAVRPTTLRRRDLHPIRQ